ncbi:MAG: hypothetical protein GY950_25670 [bacterium]|nr:hypothetical protein [bacterium]
MKSFAGSQGQVPRFSKEPLVERLRGTGVLDRFPVEKYIGLLDRYKFGAHYRYVSPDVRHFCDGIIEAGGEGELELYHKLVLVTLVERAREQPGFLKFPADVQQLFTVNFDRILKKIDSGRAKRGYYLYSGDKFFKDLGTCRLTLIPAGAQKLYVGRMGRKFLIKGGWLQSLRGLRLLVFETRGFKPFYRMAMDSRDRDLMKEFNPGGWVRFFKRAAELLKIDKRIKGVCGSSWFFDPLLKEISPELSYLRDTVLEGGARIFYVDTSEGAVRDALTMSPKRIKLHKEGKYHPKIYMMVLPRKRLIKWADEMEE